MKLIKGYDTSIGGHWVTIAGRRVFIRDGQTKSEAMIESGKFNNDVYNENNTQYVKDEKGEYIIHNGKRIDYIKKKEYDNKSEQLNTNLQPIERNTVLKYVRCPEYAASGELNSLNKDNIDKIYDFGDAFYGNSSIRETRPSTLHYITDNADRLYTGYEYDKKIINDYKENIIDKNITDNYDIRHKGQDLGYGEYSFSEDRIEERKIKVNKYKDEKYRNEYINKLEKLDDFAKKEQNKVINFRENYDKRESVWSDEEYKILEKQVIKNIHDKEIELGLPLNSYQDEYRGTPDLKYFKEKQYIIEEDYKRKYGNIKMLIDKVKKGDTNTMSSETIREIQNTINEQKKLDNVFETKGITFDKPILVYRRARETDEQIKEGFTKLGYLSTTYKNHIAKKMPSGVPFGDKEEIIIVPAGVKVLPLRKIIETRITPDETGNEGFLGVAKQNEILLPRDSYYKFIRYDWETKRYIVVLERKS